MIDKFILDGHEVKPVTDLLTWANWFEKVDRVVKFDTIGETDISTVFLGMAFGFKGDRPLVFETLVSSNIAEETKTTRYCTWEEAVAGHENAVKKVTSKM